MKSLILIIFAILVLLPPDFANASPFPHRQKEKDATPTAILATAAVAIVAFLISLLGLFQIHGPR